MELFAKPVAIATFFVLLALLWTFALQRTIAYPFVFLFFAAVMCSAWFGGFVAGIVAVAISSFLVEFFFIPPFYSFSIAHEFRTYVTAFILCSIGITAISATRKRSEAAVRAARDELEIRVRQRTAELERSNAEIMERELHLRQLTEAIPQQIWRTDGSGSIEYGNAVLLEYLGIQARDLAGDGFFGVFHREDAQLVKTSWETAQAKIAKFETKARIRGVDGRYRWFLVRGNPQLTADGTVTRWYGVHIDIEEQQKAQEELILSQEHLARLSRTLSMAEMAASIAHEINQPLTALLSEAHACRRWLQLTPANVDRATSTAERMVRETTRASEVVKRIRSLFSRTEYVRTNTDPNKLIRDLARLLRDEAIRRGVSLRLRLAENIPKLSLDPVQIQQVILNLVTNGMDAMAQSDGVRELEISTELRDRTEVVVTVRDSGMGLDDRMRSKIFEPFFTTKPDGIGMGLAICRSTIEEHDGRIWADSSGRGTAIHFSLRTTS